jgi:hypothetical protein
LISKETPPTSAVHRRTQDRQKSSKVVRKSSKVVKTAVNPLKQQLKDQSTVPAKTQDGHTLPIPGRRARPFPVRSKRAFSRDICLRGAKIKEKSPCFGGRAPWRARLGETGFEVVSSEVAG